MSGVRRHLELLSWRPRMVILICLTVGLALASTVPASAATVTTDKGDYYPGETVVVTGSGWLPGEIVELYFHEEPETHPDTTAWAVADADGNITNEDFFPDISDVGRTFTLTATGQTSGVTAQTTFTDSNIQSDCPGGHTLDPTCTDSGLTGPCVWGCRNNSNDNCNPGVAAWAPNGTSCGDSGTECRNQDTCSAGTCADNGFKPATTHCTTGTSQGGACDEDAADHCSGTADTCVDAFKSSATVCRGAANECDVAESCTGTSGACPADAFQSAATLCTGASQGDACDDDAADHCSGTAATCVDAFKSSATVCRLAANACDEAETCTGSSAACPADAFKSAATLCNFGVSTGGACDDDGADHCSGTAATCVDAFKSSATVCRSAANACDEAESCTGSSGACPADAFKSAATLCNFGASQGGACDNDAADHCSGTAATCVDVFKSSYTVCRPAANACDVAESCTGSSGTCPVDGFQSAATHCTFGTSNGGTCDDNPADHCSGTAATCVDAFKSSATVCRTAVNDCDVAESCTGSSGTCPVDGFKSAATLCDFGSSTGGACDNDAADHCAGNSATCVDAFKSSYTVCRAAVNACDMAESCTGSSGACPADAFKPSTTHCTFGSSTGGACDYDAGDHCSGSAATCVDAFKPSTTVCRAAVNGCDEAENCTGTSGACPANGFKSEDTLCSFGSSQGGACDDDAADHCAGTSATCVDAFQPCGAVTSSELCQFDEDTTQCQGRVFNALFTPDVKLWPAYKQNATNPGQFYYNLITNGNPGQSKTVAIKIPWPFVTVGGQPIHVYDLNDVDVQTQTGAGKLICFTPGDNAPSTPYSTKITLLDWASGTNTSALHCDTVSGPAGGGFCTLNLNVTIPASGQAYVNIHLDYGFKGPDVDANPVNGVTDRYDRGAADGAGWDALQNTPTDNGPLAIDNCTDYAFSHTSGSESENDHVYNLNLFKTIAGAFGTANHSSNGDPIQPGVVVQLIQNGTVVKSAVTDKDGFFFLTYKHTGKAAPYTVKLGAPYNLSTPTTLKANGWASVTFDVDTKTATSETACGSNPNCN